MGERSPYEVLDDAYYRAMNICDPIQYQLRQQALLHALANYVLQKDKPINEENLKELDND